MNKGLNLDAKGGISQLTVNVTTESYVLQSLNLLIAVFSQTTYLFAEVFKAIIILKKPQICINMF